MENKMAIDQKELEVVKGQVSKLEDQANNVIITSPEENESAMNLKATLKETGKSITKRKEEITKPLNEALKSARAFFAPLEDQIEKAEGIIGRKLLAYKQKVDAEARAKEAAIAKKVEDGKMKIQTAEKKMEAVQETKVDKTTRTDHGTVQFRKIKKVRFANFGSLSNEQIIVLIGRGYLIWDEVKARKNALTGEDIPGVEVYEEEIV